MRTTETSMSTIRLECIFSKCPYIRLLTFQASYWALVGSCPASLALGVGVGGKTNKQLVRLLQFAATQLEPSKSLAADFRLNGVKNLLSVGALLGLPSARGVPRGASARRARAHASKPTRDVRAQSQIAADTIDLSNSAASTHRSVSHLLLVWLPTQLAQPDTRPTLASRGVCFLN